MLQCYILNKVEKAVEHLSLVLVPFPPKGSILRTSLRNYAYIKDTVLSAMPRELGRCSNRLVSGGCCAPNPGCFGWKNVCHYQSYRQRSASRAYQWTNSCTIVCSSRPCVFFNSRGVLLPFCIIAHLSIFAWALLCGLSSSLEESSCTKRLESIPPNAISNMSCVTMLKSTKLITFHVFSTLASDADVPGFLLNNKWRSVNLPVFYGTLQKAATFQFHAVPCSTFSHPLRLRCPVGGTPHASTAPGGPSELRAATGDVEGGTVVPSRPRRWVEFPVSGIPGGNEQNDHWKV